MKDARSTADEQMAVWMLAPHHVVRGLENIRARTGALIKVATGTGVDLVDGAGLIRNAPHCFALFCQDGWGIVLSSDAKRFMPMLS